MLLFLHYFIFTCQINNYLFTLFTSSKINYQKVSLDIKFISNRSAGASGRIRTCDHPLRRRVLYPAELRTLYESEQAKKWSVRQDSNLRPLGPKPSALPSCATHRTIVAIKTSSLRGGAYYPLALTSSNTFLEIFSNWLIIKQLVYKICVLYTRFLEK